MRTVHPVEKLWREIGLPEYFLGNGGSNTKLYELYDRIMRGGLAQAQQQWRPIETNPFVSAKRCLLTEGDRLAIPFIGFRIYKAGPWFHDGFGEVYPTHWMGLPSTSSLTSTDRGGDNG